MKQEYVLAYMDMGVFNQVILYNITTRTFESLGLDKRYRSKKWSKQKHRHVHTLETIKETKYLELLDYWFE